MAIIRRTPAVLLCMLASCQCFVPRYGPRQGASGMVAFSAMSSVLRPTEQAAISLDEDNQHDHDDDCASTSKCTAAGRQASSTTLKDSLQAGDVERALEALHHMTSPTTADYNLVLTAYAQEGRVTEAESLVKHMVNRCREQQSIYRKCAQPDRNTYYQLLDALLQSGLRNSADRAEEILLAIVEHFGSARTVAFNKVLKLWKQEAEYDADVALERAEILLQNMVELGIADRISFATVIAILAVQGDAVRANEMAEHMVSSADPNLFPNTQTWNTVIHAWVRRGKLERAEQVLKRMDQLAGEDNSAKPDVVSFSTLLDGWAKSKHDDALSKMKHLVNRMKASGCQLNFWIYVTLIHAYARQRGDPQKAQDLLLDMYEARKQHPELKPNTKLVTAVMDAWQKSGQGAEKAEALLNWMISVGETDRDLAPNEYSFSSAISAWGKSRSMGKAFRARQILNRMIELHEQGRFELAHPNTVCYTAVINCCAYSKNCDDVDKQAALRIAIETFKELEKSPHVQPNEVTFSNLLTAIRNLLPTSDRRNAVAKDVFQSAAAKGYCDPLVVQRLKSTLPRNEILDLLPPNLSSSGEGLVPIDLIPSEWCRNVKK